MENAQHQDGQVDPATAAFSRLEREVGEVHKLVVANDQSITLGEISVSLEKMHKAVEGITRHPALGLSPEAMSSRISAAGETARKADSATIAQARDRIDRAARGMEALIGTAATIREQRRRLLWGCGGSVVAGMLLWSVLPGLISQSMPERWHLPEGMAVRAMRAPSMWQAGTRLMKVGSPPAWAGLEDAAMILRDNRKAIEKCRTDARQKQRRISCKIQIEAAL